MEMLPFQELLDEHVEKLKAGLDAKRGNYQESFGFCSGHSFQPRDRANVEENFGASIPGIRVGTETFLRVMKVLADLCVETGMVVTDADFLARHPELAKEIRFVEENFGLNLVNALVTATFLRMNKGQSQVYCHTDDQNGDRLTQVLSAGCIVRDVHGE